MRTTSSYAKLESERGIHPADELPNAYPGFLSWLQEEFQRRRQIRRQDGSLSPLQDQDHGPGEAGGSQGPCADEFSGGGKSTTGKLLLKPIAREKVRITPLGIAAIAGGVIAAVVYAVVLRKFTAGPDAETPRQVLCGLGTVVGPPLAIAAYGFLRDDELEPYRGKQLYPGAIDGLMRCFGPYLPISGRDFPKTALSALHVDAIVPPFFIRRRHGGQSLVRPGNRQRLFP